MAQNQLHNARSAYLRSALHQPVQWMEWSPAAFAQATLENKPILLDIGAVWCHWCHVMDRESYEDADTARLINEHFIAIKVDRDERPDIDTRYQAAVAAISGQGGWPLTAFLTPDGRPFFGGTYFPPVDGHGRPSLRRVLMTMAEAYEQRPGEVAESATSVMAAIEHNETFNGSAPEPGAELLGKLIAATLQQFDPRYGGFGSQPKFPHSGAIDLLLDAAARPGDKDHKCLQTAMFTLQKMAQGGIYDQLAGGFHRYSVDERWVVPHFEKMSYDNSELLRNYLHAYQSSGDAECARIARETIAWIDEWLSDREHGGFYASQDADASLEDDGDYFTWTRAETANVLTAKELALAGSWFDIGELGDMHHNAEKNVLHLEQTLETLVQSARLTSAEVLTLLEESKRKLYAARKLRPTPYVDKTIYVAWNGMMISAYLLAGRVLEDATAREFGLKSLDRVLAEAWDGTRLAHVVAYGEGGPAGDVAAGLDDYLMLAHAALDAWEMTASMRYFEVALALLKTTLDSFYDHVRGGFFDTPADPAAPGALSARRKPMQDSPTPAGNSVGASLLLRLAELTGEPDFHSKAKATLECFAGVVEHFGLYAASYGLALQRMVQAPVQVVVVGQDDLADRLERVALGRYLVNKSVVRLHTQDVALPPALAETIPHLPAQAGSFAVVCSGFTCGLPVGSVEGLVAALRVA